MQFARDFQMRLRSAAALNASPWICMLALIAGALVAGALVSLAPAGGSDIAKAKALGIVSETILAGHSKSADSFAYAMGLSSAILTSILIWTAWAMWAGRNRTPVSLPLPTSLPRVRPHEFAIAALVAFGLFARIWNGRAATLSAWSALSEEGEMLAWIDTMLRGGVLSRDTFCLYGPLSVWAVAVLFHLLHPSMGLWRSWIFGLNAPALLAAYFLLRGIARTRMAAIAGTLAAGVLAAGEPPAMSWSMGRVGFGLAALAALNRALNRETWNWYMATGALASATLLYSPEVGISCVAAIALVLVLHSRRWFAICWTTFGAAILLTPAILYLIATNSLAATIDNMILFSRVRILGFCALAFPWLELNVDSLNSYFTPAVLAVSAFFTATKLLRGERDARAFTETALIVFGALLFNAAVSRADDIHLQFAVPPALVLLAGLLENACFALRSPNQRIPAAAALVLGAAALLPWNMIAWENVRSLFAPPSGRTLALERGGSALFPDEFATDLEQVTRAIQARTAPDEPIWVFPNEALLYFLADRPQPTRFPLAIFAVTREQREELVADLERSRPLWAVVYRDAPLLDRVPYSEAMPEVVAYLNKNYGFERNIGAFVLLRRKE